MKTIDALKSLRKLLVAGEWAQIEKTGPGRHRFFSVGPSQGLTLPLEISQGDCEDPTNPRNQASRLLELPGLCVVMLSIIIPVRHLRGPISLSMPITHTLQGSQYVFLNMHAPHPDPHHSGFLCWNSYSQHDYWEVGSVEEGLVLRMESLWMILVRYS